MSQYKRVRPSNNNIKTRFIYNQRHVCFQIWMMIQRRETPKQWDSAHRASYIQGPNDNCKTQLTILRTRCFIYLRFTKFVPCENKRTQNCCAHRCITVTVLGRYDVVRGSCPADTLQQQISCSRYTPYGQNNCDNLSISESCIDMPTSCELAVERQAKSDKLLN
jgi:hypothetical protein